MLTDKQQSALYFARKRHRIANSLAGEFTPVLTATVNVAYDGFTVTATGGEKPHTFSVWSGSFPDGVDIDASTGVVSGTPTEAGTFAVALAVTDAYGTVRALPSFTITVSE